MSSLRRRKPAHLDEDDLAPPPHIEIPPSPSSSDDSDKQQIPLLQNKELLAEIREKQVQLRAKFAAQVMASTQPNKKKGVAYYIQMAKDGIHHTKIGFKTLYRNAQIAWKYGRKLGRGEELSRRELHLVMLTTRDLFRLIPFSLFVIIPGAELLLPFALMIFPGMLPSTFVTESDSDKKLRSAMPRKFSETSTLARIAYKKLPADIKYLDEMRVFDATISGEPVSANDIRIAAPYLRGSLTVESLNYVELQAIMRFFSLSPYGSFVYLRRSMYRHIDKLEKDDRMIDREGIDSLSSKEVIAAVHERRMRAYGLSDEDARAQLSDYISLSLDPHVSNEILLFLRPKKESLLQTLRVFDSDAINSVINSPQLPPETRDKIIRSLPDLIHEEVSQEAQLLMTRRGSIRDMQKRLEELESEESKITAEMQLVAAAREAKKEHNEEVPAPAATETPASAAAYTVPADEQVKESLASKTPSDMTAAVTAADTTVAASASDSSAAAAAETTSTTATADPQHASAADSGAVPEPDERTEEEQEEEAKQLIEEARRKAHQLLATEAEVECAPPSLAQSIENMDDEDVDTMASLETEAELLAEAISAAKAAEAVEEEAAAAAAAAAEEAGQEVAIKTPPDAATTATDGAGVTTTRAAKK